jgi:hypothetical protein
MRSVKEIIEDMKSRPVVTENDLKVIIEAVQKEAFLAGKKSVESLPDSISEALNSGDGSYKP